MGGHSHYCMCQRCTDKLNRSYNRAMKQRRGSGNTYRGTGKTNRSFPADNGTVDGQSAYILKDGDRTEAYTGPEHEGKVVTNDGVNAEYLRDDDGNVIMNSNAPDPYNPGPWRRH